MADATTVWLSVTLFLKQQLPCMPMPYSCTQNHLLVLCSQLCNPHIRLNVQMCVYVCVSGETVPSSLRRLNTHTLSRMFFNANPIQLVKSAQYWFHILLYVCCRALTTRTSKGWYSQEQSLEAQFTPTISCM